MRNMHAKSSLLALSIWGAALSVGIPAQAVVLQQKWVAGQPLNYDVAMDGTMKMEAPADAAVFFAGIPLQSKIKLKSQTRWDTVSVDDAGVSTLSPHLVTLSLSGSLLGQNGEFTLANGKAALAVNGEPADFAGKLDGKKIADPPITVNISKLGHIDSLALVKPPGSAAAPIPADPTPATPGPATPGPATPRPATPANPGEAQEHPAAKIAKFINLWLTSSLPSLWPDRDVQPGDTWTAEIRPPLGSALSHGALARLAPFLTLGAFKFQYQGDELQEGHKVAHVTMNGQVEVDGLLAALLSDEIAKTGAGAMVKGMRLTDAKQTVDGDLWFDADAGQLVKAILNLHSHAGGTLPKAPDAPATIGLPKPSTLDFDGIVQIQLHAAP